MNKIKLLYAEDEQQTRKNHIIYLQSRYDLIVYEANNGVEALDIYIRNKPDIVLTDITMPKMCGLTLAKEIRKISHHTKIIILTAHSEQDKLMQAFDSNVINYLIKPIDRKKLRNSIEIAMETIHNPYDNDKNIIHLNNTSKYDITKQLYIVDDNIIKLSKSELMLLDLLCKNKNTELNSFDIFIHIWDDLEKEYSSESVRTLIKKLRKKLPEGILKNTYGGFYKLLI